MKKAFKICLFSSILLFVLGVFFATYFCFFYQYKGKDIQNLWNKTQAFSKDSISIVKKEKDKDFVILNLADIQMCDIEDFFHMHVIKKEIKYLVSIAKPDLITLTGDQTWSNENLISLKRLIRWLDKLGIPYAPVFGNHDYGNDYNSSVLTLNKCCDLYEKGKYSLFKRGPSNLGSLGNYVVGIEEEGKIVKVLYMVDSGYINDFSDFQIEWIKWNAEGLKEDDKYVSSMLFTHKPISEFKDAYSQYLLGRACNITPVYRFCSLNGIDGNGIYEVGKTINIKDYVAAHQHTNSFSILYDDTRFTFALKTGELSFFYDDGNIVLNGGTVFKINGDDVIIENIYTPSGMFRIKNSDNRA